MARPITIQDLLAVMPGEYKIIVNKGSQEYVGACPLCGGRDRFQLKIGRNGGVVWWCRHQENHPGMTPKDYFGDSLYEKITGRKWGDGAETWRERPYVPPVELEPKYAAPSFGELPKVAWPKPNERPMTVEDVDKWHEQGGANAASYYRKFGISEETTAYFRLGWAIDETQCLSRLPAGYSIPDIALGPEGQLKLRGVQFRRDDDICMEQLLSRSIQWRGLEKDKLFRFWKTEVERGKMPEMACHYPTDKDLMNKLWPKYSSVHGTQKGVWNDALVTLPDGSRPGPYLPYLFVNEDAKSAMLFAQLGYPAIAYHRSKQWDAFLPTVFSRVGCLIIIANDDRDWNNAGRGMVMARDLYDAAMAGGNRRLQDAKIIFPLGGYSDIADMVAAQKIGSIREMIQTRIPGIAPVLEPISSEDDDEDISA